MSLTGNTIANLILRGKISKLPTPDKTLTKEGKSADAKAVGDALKKKVNILDIIDNLFTSSTDKPLSANQGKVLKGYIDNAVVTTTAHLEEAITSYENAVTELKQATTAYENALGVSDTGLSAKIDAVNEYAEETRRMLDEDVAYYLQFDPTGEYHTTVDDGYYATREYIKQNRTYIDELKAAVQTLTDEVNALKG